MSEALSQDVLLTSEGSSQQNLPPLIANIREVNISYVCSPTEYWPHPPPLAQLLLLGYRLEHCFTGLTPDLLLRAKMVRVLANALSLLLATHMDIDTGNRWLYKGVFFVRIRPVFRAMPYLVLGMSDFKTKGYCLVVLQYGTKDWGPWDAFELLFDVVAIWTHCPTPLTRPAFMQSDFCLHIISKLSSLYVYIIRQSVLWQNILFATLFKRVLKFSF